MDAAITRTTAIAVASAEAAERSAAKSAIGFLAWTVVLTGFVALVSGMVFLWNGYSANRLVADRLVAEQVTLSGSTGVIVSNAQQAEQQAATVREHRTTRYGLYADTSGDARITYVNALTLENSLGLAILAFGVAQMAMGSGGVMILLGIALVAIGLALRQLDQRVVRLSLA